MKYNFCQSFQRPINTLCGLFFATSLTISFASDGIAGEENVTLSPQVQQTIKGDKCAKRAAYRSAMDALSVISDSGVDWPDTLAVSYLETFSIDNRTSYRIVAENMAFQYTLLNKSRCDLSAAKRLITIPDDVKWISRDLQELTKLGNDYLGQEIFDQNNIGGVTTFTANDDKGYVSNSASLVRQYYTEWREDIFRDSLKVNKETNRSESNIRKVLAEVLGVKPSDENAAKITERFVKSLYQALKSNESFELVTGTWTASGIGDPYAGFVAVVATKSQKVLLLEQGYAD